MIIPGRIHTKMVLVICWIVLASTAVTMGHIAKPGSPTYTVYIVCDGSESISKASFQQIKAGLKDFTNKSLAICPTTELGVVVFSDAVTEVITASNNTSRVLAAIENIVYPSSGTRTDLGIQHATELLNRSPPQNTKVMIIVTDGLSNLPASTSLEASLAKTQNISVFSVGVTSRVASVSGIRQLYMNELNTIASSNDTVFIYDTFTSFAETFGDLTYQILKGQPCQISCEVPIQANPLVDYTLVYILAGVCAFQFVIIILGLVVFFLSRRRQHCP